MAELTKRAEEHCGKGVLEEACLLELGWYMKEAIVTYVQYERCGEKRCHVEKNRRQGVIKDRQRWYGYQKKEEKKVAHDQESQKAQPKKGVVKGRSGEPSKC